MHREYHTRCKDQIMCFLQEKKDRRFSAAELYQALQKQRRNVNLTTVYRNLEKLTDQGIVLKFKDNREDCYMYQYVGEHTDCKEHLHLQCKSCGKVLHMSKECMEQLASCIAGMNGFQILCEESVLIGECEDCRKKRS